MEEELKNWKKTAMANKLLNISGNVYNLIQDMKSNRLRLRILSMVRIQSVY